MTSPRRFSLIALVLPAFAAPHPSPGLQSDSPTSAYEVSGIRVIHRLRPSTDIVSVRLFILGGSRQLRESPEGIEALLLRAITAESNALLDVAGARHLMSVGHDWSTSGFLTLRENFTQAWDAWASALTGPELSGAVVRRSRDILMSEARQRYADADTRVRWLAWQSMFRNHPYQFDPWGTVDSLRRLTPTAVRAYWEEQFVTTRLLLVIVGDVSQDAVSARVGETLGTLPRGHYAWVPPPPVLKFPNSWRTESRDLPTNYIQGFILGPRPGERDYYAFEVATNLLSGRLNSVLRNQRSLTYATYARFQEAAIPTATVYASSQNPGEVYRLLIDQLEWVQTLDRVPGWALNQYLDQFTVDQLSRNLTADGQALSLGQAELLFGDHVMADRYLESIRDVSPREIRRVAIEYMRDLQLAYLGNTRLLGAGMVRQP